MTHGSLTGNTPLIYRVVPDHASPLGRVAALAGMVLLATLVLTLSAKIKVPFYPVPMTMQTAAVLLIGVAFGARLGIATVMLYLAQGAAGLPVFAGTPELGVGLPYMMGPTGGFLLGFAAAAGIAGLAVSWGLDRRPLPFIAALVMAAGSIHVFGVIWLSQFTGVGPALQAGSVPFLLGDVLKVGVVAAAVILARRAADKR